MNSQPSSDIWHDVCIVCQPNMDIAICGTKIEYNPDESTIGEVEGQNCVVCVSMLCPTCPEEEQKEIIGRVG